MDTDPPKYISPVLLQVIHVEKYFSKEDIATSHVLGKTFQMTDKGLYSISKYYDAQWITETIVAYLKNLGFDATHENMIDSTAGLGGNTISFSKSFQWVHAVEINDIHFSVLKNNVETAGRKNVTYYHSNFIELLDKNVLPSSSLFFMDPPWGGKSYKNYKYFHLKLGKLPIYTVINILFEKKFKFVILKAPFNLNLSLLYENVKYKHMNISRPMNKNMILIIFGA